MYCSPILSFPLKGSSGQDIYFLEIRKTNLFQQKQIQVAILVPIINQVTDDISKTSIKDAAASALVTEII